MNRWRIAWPIVAACALALAVSGRAQERGAEPSGLFRQLRFRDLGPAIAGGRVTAVVGIPGNPKVYYIGAAGGGVWKTTDGGQSWNPIFEHEASASIGAIALAPSSPNLVWVGTGESSIRNDTIDGAGLYFSPDGGQTWKQMGFEDAGQISSILIDPHDSDTVFVGVLGHAWAPNIERGVFKTTDGGKTWKKVLYVNDTTGVSDLVMAPNNPEVLLAAMWQVRRYPWALEDGGAASGIYRSTDGGGKWTKLTRGLPKGPLGRIALAIAPTNPDRIYALVEARHGVLWESRDMGDSWRQVSDNHALDVRPFYFSRLFVAPNDENRIYFCSLHLMESGNGGRSAHDADPAVHADHHALWIDPKNPSRVIQGNDGGAWLSLDGAKHWRFLDGMPIEQDYMVGISARVPYTLCAGLQDNNSWCGNGRDGWYRVSGGDGEYTVPAPSDASIIYADSQSGSILRLDLRHRVRWSIRPYLADAEDEAPSRLKYRFNWTAPIAVSPSDANQVYLGANVLFESTDGGRNWTVISPDLTRDDKAKQIVSGGPVDSDVSGAETYDTITSIAIAPGDAKVIWVGSDDGLVHVTRDGGRDWSNVTAEIPGAPMWARVYQIGVSPFDPATAYVSFDAHMLDDDRPYVYRTSDFGKTWQEIVGGLPDEPVYVVREDPNRRGLLVLGNDTGLYFSTDDGGHWQRFPVEFPTAPVWDLRFAKPEHDLAVATHGRGLFQLHDIRPIEEMTVPIASSPFHLFAINDAFLLSRFYFGMQGQRSATYFPPPARQGARIDYYLKTAIGGPGPGPDRRPARRGPVKITIRDSAGHLVATGYGPARAGVNRFVWNLRYDPATPIRGKARRRHGGFFGNPSGPRVAPGTYRVSVAAGAQTQTQAVTVLPDPRIPAVAGAFHQEVAFGLQARDMLSAVDEMINRIDGLKSQIATFLGAARASTELVAEPDSGKLLTQARSLSRQLETIEERVYNTKIQRGVTEDDIHYLTDLRGQIEDLMGKGWIGYGQPPSPQAHQRMRGLRRKLDGRLAVFNQFLQTGVAGYNRLAQANNAPTLLGGSPIAFQVRRPASGR
ncbi:MAG TPA: hypothetical protein VNJ52_01585 [Patescibacteria group bacterium]|nr:hypothetical protein [Patescibacteria group bacterium]